MRAGSGHMGQQEDMGREIRDGNHAGLGYEGGERGRQVQA